MLVQRCATYSIIICNFIAIDIPIYQRWRNMLSGIDFYRCKLTNMNQGTDAGLWGGCKIGEGDSGSSGGCRISGRCRSIQGQMQDHVLSRRRENDILKDVDVSKETLYTWTQSKAKRVKI